MPGLSVSRVPEAAPQLTQEAGSRGARSQSRPSSTFLHHSPQAGHAIWEGPRSRDLMCNMSWGPRGGKAPSVPGTPSLTPSQNQGLCLHCRLSDMVRSGPARRAAALCPAHQAARPSPGSQLYIHPHPSTSHVGSRSYFMPAPAPSSLVLFHIHRHAD